MSSNVFQRLLLPSSTIASSMTVVVMVMSCCSLLCQAQGDPVSYPDAADVLLDDSLDASSSVVTPSSAAGAAAAAAATESVGESEAAPFTLKPKPYPPDRANVYPYIKQQVPPFYFAVWDESGQVCILAKLEASFTITYDTKYGKQQMMDRLDTIAARADGRCESVLDEQPLMDIKWRGGFIFRLIFEKVPLTVNAKSRPTSAIPTRVFSCRTSS